MSTKPCYSCGEPVDVTTLDGPTKHCPNPACEAPMDAEAVRFTTFPAIDPTDAHDSLRTKLREQALADVATMQPDPDPVA